MKLGKHLYTRQINSIQLVLAVTLLQENYNGLTMSFDTKLTFPIATDM